MVIGDDVAVVDDADAAGERRLSMASRLRRISSWVNGVCWVLLGSSWWSDGCCCGGGVDGSLSFLPSSTLALKLNMFSDDFLLLLPLCGCEV